MAEMGKQFSHADVAVGLLPGQFENSTDLRDLVAKVVGTTTGIQELEDALWDLYSRRWLWIATGQQLDGLGDILEEPRNSDDDEEYRDLLYLKVLINVSQGEPERVIEATLAATRATEAHLIEKPFAALVVYAHGLERWDLADRLGRVSPGGVRTVVTGSEDTTPFVFGVDRDAAGAAHGAELAYGAGWGETGAGNEAEGGAISEVFYQ